MAFNHTFTINFGTGLCGLEILFDEKTKRFTVGKVFSESSPTAAKFAEVLPGAIIIALNDQPTTNLTSMPQIQEMFKAAKDANKMVMFKTYLTGDREEKLKEHYKNSNLIIKENDLYYAILPRRPLGFTIAASPGEGVVEVCQVDSVHEENILLGSKLIKVNGEKVKDLPHGIDMLLKKKMPAVLLLEKVQELFKDDQKQEEAQSDKWMLQAHDKADEIELECTFLDAGLKAAHGTFHIPVGKHSPVALIRGQVATLCGLKFEALNLVCNGKRMDDDAQEIWNAIYNKKTDKRSYAVIVVLSKTKQEKKVIVGKPDYRTRMRIMGAYFKKVNPIIMSYLWDDIDHEKKSLLHITELDRLLARLTGVYERAMSIKPIMEYQLEAVKFETKRNLGLVIEGNEVIMCHSNSQAAEQGILPAWKVVGAEYILKKDAPSNFDKKEKRIKLTVDHKSCLQSLKRAKTECNPDGFKVLCQKPVGERYELQIVMKKQAIGDLSLNDGSQTLTKEHYNKLAGVFAPKAYRFVIPSKPADELGIEITSEGKGKKGVYVKSVSAKYKNDIGVGDRVIGIGAQDVASMTLDKVMKIWGTKFPFVITLDKATDYDAIDADDEKEA